MEVVQEYQSCIQCSHLLFPVSITETEYNVCGFNQSINHRVGVCCTISSALTLLPYYVQDLAHSPRRIFAFIYYNRVVTIDLLYYLY